MTYYDLYQVCKVCRRRNKPKSFIFISNKKGKEYTKMNETLLDLKEKREVVEKDIEILFKTLKEELKENAQTD